MKPLSEKQWKEIEQTESMLEDICRILKVSSSQVPERVKKLIEENKKLKEEIKKLNEGSGS